MKFVFRVDASIQMGTGHVMRCLTLADTLRIKGNETHFICSEHSGNLISRIMEHGHQVHRIPMGDTQDDKIRETKYGPDLSVHNHWLGSTWQADAESTVNIIENLIPDWLVIDHYALDFNWEYIVRDKCKKIMVIDDLADRKHYCDLLMDQTFGRKEDDYKNLVPDECDLLLGSEYVLLRNEFSELRTKALQQRDKVPNVHRIMVTLGGTDPDNVTDIVLKGLDQSELKNNTEVDVLLGSNSPHKESIRYLISNMSLNARLSIDVDDVAERILKADLAIGAGGTTSWERCCLGLPTLIIINAINQEKIVNELENHGAVINMGQHQQLTSEKISREINNVIKNPEILMKLSEKAFEVVDGNGVDNVIKYLH